MKQSCQWCTVFSIRTDSTFFIPLDNYKYDIPVDSGACADSQYCDLCNKIINAGIITAGIDARSV